MGAKGLCASCPGRVLGEPGFQGCHLPQSQTACRAQRFGNPISSGMASAESRADGSSLTWPRSSWSPPTHGGVSSENTGVGKGPSQGFLQATQEACG